MRNVNNLILFSALIVVVSSSLISYFFVRNNELQIASLSAELQMSEPIIRDIWANVVEKENKVNVVVLLSTLSENQNNNKIKPLIDYYLSAMSLSKNSRDNLAILKVLEQEKKEAIESINTVYLERAKIKNEISHIEKENKLYANIAFILQLLSLIFLIVEKLIRR